MVEYTLFPGEKTDGRQATVTADGLEELLTYDDVLKGINGTSTAVLTATGYKPGMWSDVAGSWDELHDLVDVMTDMGVNCALRTDASYDPEEEYVWTSLIATRYPINPEPLDVPGNVERPSYDLDYLETTFDPSNETVDAVEREKGAFLGYPESGTEEYLRRRRVGDREIPYTLCGNGAIDAFGSEYGLTGEEQDHVQLLRSYAIENTADAFEDMLWDVETRYRALESIEDAYNVPVTQVAEL